jgi:hypothetical protein
MFFPLKIGYNLAFGFSLKVYFINNYVTRQHLVNFGYCDVWTSMPNSTLLYDNNLAARVMSQRIWFLPGLRLPRDGYPEGPEGGLEAQRKSVKERKKERKKEKAFLNDLGRGPEAPKKKRNRKKKKERTKKERNDFSPRAIQILNAFSQRDLFIIHTIQESCLGLIALLSVTPELDKAHDDLWLILHWADSVGTAISSKLSFLVLTCKL